jgi:TolA-binding protein
MQSRTVLALAVVAVCLAAPLTAKRLAPGRVAEQSASAAVVVPAEFPPSDIQIANQEAAAVRLNALLGDTNAAAETPDNVAFLLTHNRSDRALAMANAIVTKHVDLLPDTVRAFRDHPTREVDELQRFRELAPPFLTAVRARLNDLPRSTAAEIAYWMLSIDANIERVTDTARRVERLKAFAQEYAGTDAALDAEFDILRAVPVRASDASLAALDDFARAHQGACVAARALYTKGFDLANMSKPKEDPTNRFFTVLDISKQLEAPPYAACEYGAKKAQSLVIGFRAYDPVYAEGNVTRVIEAYLSFARTHFTVDEVSPSGNGFGYLITVKVPALRKQDGQDEAALEQDLASLEKEAPDSTAVRYLSAVYFSDRARDVRSNPVGSPSVTKAVSGLRALSDSGSDLYPRRALATLASFHYTRTEYSEARAVYLEYLQKYPNSSYAWVAALRVGYCDEQTGDFKGARETYVRTAQAYPDHPASRFMAQAALGRAEDGLGSFESARAAYQTAIDWWDNGFGQSLTVAERVNKDDLRSRLAELTRTMKAPGGAAVERGRWLIKQRKWKDAQTTLAAALREFSKSANAPEARYLLHRARLEEGVELAGETRSAADHYAANAILDALQKEESDAAVAAAGITKACLLVLNDKAPDAEAVVTAALTRLRDEQRAEISKTKMMPLERDVAEIRQVVFKPLGDAMYERGRWNAFDWPRSLPAFVMIGADVVVTLPDADPTTMTLLQAFPDFQNAVFLQKEHIDLLGRMLVALGGNRQGQRQSVMSTPNQPIGASRNLATFLDRCFPTRPGDWGGWEFLTYPVTTRVLFLNKERTKARASVTIGYSGADVVLEKVDGTWTATGLVNQWIS